MRALGLQFLLFPFICVGRAGQIAQARDRQPMSTHVNPCSEGSTHWPYRCLLSLSTVNTVNLALSAIVPLASSIRGARRSPSTCHLRFSKLLGKGTPLKVSWTALESLRAECDSLPISASFAADCRSINQWLRRMGLLS